MSRESTEIIRRINGGLDQLVLYRNDIKRLLIIALISRGHLLIEGLPGTAKTLLAHTFAHLLGGDFKRIQATSDMLPADITGFYLYHPGKEEEFKPGPIFANVVMVDELNRLSPRTQSALLEAMQEHQVTVEGHTHPLPAPFTVVASQVPYGGPGTTALPDVQADRFLLRAWSGYPDAAEEDEVLKNIDRISESHARPVVNNDEVLSLHREMTGVTVSDAVRGYIIDIIGRVRRHGDVQTAPSTRGSIALMHACRSLALMSERDYVIPDDIKELAIPALHHRIHLKPEAEADGQTPERIIREILDETPVPRV
ncbi:MoxR-like ATPase [Dehalogenimonas formicexedens]|uniref:MoxR-like ATPase n=1 Tax=Dehalogenimonas formicexedens TaxID=1839801 RepID=A0A1P8F9I4_9CHLR|nr:MoxR family ATPase [Dehalogenimonas formicexedens]APV45131.1 MoxR-like ATPase [Dehalogenimonas formicexedens]